MHFSIQDKNEHAVGKSNAWIPPRQPTTEKKGRLESLVHGRIGADGGVVAVGEFGVGFEGFAGFVCEGAGWSAGVSLGSISD